VNRAVLLPNIVGFPSESMRRYALELGRALRADAPPAWGIDEIDCAPEPWIARALGDKMAGRHARFIKYPRLIRGKRGADIYHILDHSHADLALSTPPAHTILTCHDVIPLLAARGLIPIPCARGARYTFPLRVRCMARCGRIIAISESTKRTLVEVAGLPAEKIRVVYYGVNPNFHPLEAGAPETPGEERRRILSLYGIPDTARVILHVSTPMRYKNTPAILRALRALKESAAALGDIYFLRIGADFFDDEKTLIDELGIGDRIRHAGRISDDGLLASHYRAADVFVFPSLWEGFGWPPLEAMACGTVAVTSDVASLPEVIGDAGLGVPPGDDRALAEALRGLFSDPAELRSRSEKCLARSRRFTWEACARDTLAVYDELVAENRRGRSLSPRG